MPITSSRVRVTGSSWRRLAVLDRLAAGAGLGPEAVSLVEGDLAATMVAGTIFSSGGVHTTAPEAQHE